MNVKITEKDRIKVADADDIFAIMRKILLREDKIDRNKEHFWFVGLAANNQLLFIELVAVGGFINASVSPREAFQVAVLKGAVGVMMVHNHPDDVLMPSEADKDLTDRFIQAGRILQIDVMDHLIITTQTFLSFAVNGLMDELNKSLKFVPPYEIAERLEEVKQNGLEWGRRKGLREGERKKAMEIAKALLGKGMDINEISEVSGLSEETIRKLAGR